MSRPERSAPASNPVLFVVGPTAAGKTGFAVEAALRFGGEIISCDSMAVYRGLDIGTDKPGPEQRRGVPHHLIDVADPGTTFSAGAFRRAALEALDAIHRRGRLAIVVGGTGLYLRALTEGLLELPGRDEEVRSRLKDRIRRSGPERLHRILARLDPAYAASIGPRDALRIVRAMEVRLLTGRPLSKWIAESPFGSRPIEGLKIGLTAQRAVLYHRIETRVEAMMAGGLLGETAALLESGALRGPAGKAIGYGECAAHLEGFLSLQEAVARIKLRSRHLAKRQVTWFNRESDIRWFFTDKEAWKDDAMEFIQRWLPKAPG